MFICSAIRSRWTSSWTRWSPRPPSIGWWSACGPPFLLQPETDGTGAGFVSPGTQVFTLLVLAIPIACISWTVTHEEVFREPHDWLVQKSKTAPHLLQRKFFYLFTCEYCFSHYVTIAALIMTRFTLIYSDWRGYVIAGFSLVWI